MTGAAPLVYVIVLNWNGWRDTTRCLTSLRSSSYPNLHVVVVDNGSTDGSPEHLAPVLEAPWGELVQAGRNLGFTGGANLGLRLALERGASYAFLLNNDATVAPDCITKLV
jgi:GT2 family glycosyltransferase